LSILKLAVSRTRKLLLQHTTDRSIRSIRRSIRVFGQTPASVNKAGTRATMTDEMVEALLLHLYEKPELYLEEMAWFIWDEFGVVISTSTISRALAKARWSKKQVR
jgi:transposase